MNGYRAVVVGATGAVGSALVHELLVSPHCEEVTMLTRRRVFPGLTGRDMLRERVVDMDDLERETADAARGYTAAFCTMGVGQPRKVAKAEVWKVDVEYAAAFARGARTAGVRHISLLSSTASSSTAKSFYLRLKGAAEAGVAAAGVAAAGVPRTSFFRPSLLVTQEIRYGLQDRLTQRLFPLLSPLLPGRYHQIRVEDLARAMRLNAERPGPDGVEILEHPDFEELLRSSPRTSIYPYATLSIFRSPGINDWPHISSLLGVEPNDIPEVTVYPRIVGPPRPFPWAISTKGRVQSDSVRVHVRSLLDAIGRRYGALEQLRSEGYSVSVFFLDTKMPKPAELSSVDAELEKHGISFDFELEREDFP